MVNVNSTISTSHRQLSLYFSVFNNISISAKANNFQLSYFHFFIPFHNLWISWTSQKKDSNPRFFFDLLLSVHFDLGFQPACFTSLDLSRNCTTFVDFIRFERHFRKLQSWLKSRRKLFLKIFRFTTVVLFWVSNLMCKEWFEFSQSSLSSYNFCNICFQLDLSSFKSQMKAQKMEFFFFFIIEFSRIHIFFG